VPDQSRQNPGSCRHVEGAWIVLFCREYTPKQRKMVMGKAMVVEAVTQRIRMSRTCTVVVEAIGRGRCQ